MNNNTGKVEINGKSYQTVAYRLVEFRKLYPIDKGWSIETERVESNEEGIIFKAAIKDPNGKVVATGHAEEKRNSSYINKTSALENAETSAIGRALAAAGFVGNEVAYEIAYAKKNAAEDTVISALPDIARPGWERTFVPKPLLPPKERGRNISWLELATDSVELQGLTKTYGGAQYLHVLDNWSFPHSPSHKIPVQNVVREALALREKLKPGLDET